MKFQIILLITLLGYIYCLEKLVLQLQRTAKDAFIPFDHEDYQDSACQVISERKTPFSSNLKETLCPDQEIVKITQECIRSNLLYKTIAYFGEPEKTKKYKKKHMHLALDLMSPWTWVKGQTCSFYTRDGELQSETCDIQDYDRKFACFTKNKDFNCQIVDKCAEIDLLYEGLLMQGKFMDTKMRFVDLDNHDGIINQRIVYAEALSGFSNYRADGVLGLGKPQKIIYNNDIDEYDQNQQLEKDEEEENLRADYEGNRNQNENLSKQFHPFDSDFHDAEQRTSILSNLAESYPSLADSIFSLYLADNFEEYMDESYFPNLQLGGSQLEKYALEYNHQQSITWLPLVHEKYYLWQVKLEKIQIYHDVQDMTFSQVERNYYVGNEDLVQIPFEEQSAIFSLETTSIVLPKEQLKQIMNTLKSRYNIKCNDGSKYLKTYNYNVHCTGLDSPTLFQNLLFTLVLEGGEQLVINPKDLVQDCRKEENESDKYECILNLQRSYDNHIILGEAAMKNYYWIFDLHNEKIGFTPAKTKYNESLFKVIQKEIEEGLGTIVEDIEYDVEFLVRFSAIIFLVLFTFITFKNIGAVVRCLEKIIGSRQRVRIESNNEPEEFVDLQQQQENERRKNTSSVKNQFDEFDSLSQRQGILNQSTQGLNQSQNSADDEHAVDLDDLDSY